MTRAFTGDVISIQRAGNCIANELAELRDDEIGNSHAIKLAKERLVRCYQKEDNGYTSVTIGEDGRYIFGHETSFTE